MGDFWQRLWQRKLVQWAIAYCAFAFALIQVLDVVADSYDWPHAAMHLLFGVLVLGFAVALVLAWYHGEKGRQRFSGPEILILALLLALGGGLLWHYARPAHAGKAVAAAQAAPAPSSPVPATQTAFHPAANTLVVLPFANLGGDPKQQYFSDGITEELTNALGQNTGLKVIAWDTASKYRDSKQSAADIGKQLNVANVLTGKILRQGNEVRVIVELVNATNGYQVWASHYDDNLKNIFQVQDKISASIADALKVKFAAARAAKSVNPQAHDLVLQARALIQTGRGAAPYEKARALLEQALRLEPDYAEAHALLARTWSDLTQFSTLSFKDVLPKVLAEAHEALALDPTNVTALIALATVDMTEGRITEARAGYQRAIELDPSNAAAHLDYALVLPPKHALAETLEAVQLDPDNATAQNNLAVNYLDSGEYAQALPASQAMVRLAHSAGSAFGLALNYALLHRDEDAVKAFDLVHPDTPLAKQLVAAGKLAYQSVLDPKLHAQALAAADALRKRSDLDPDSLYNLFMVYLVLDKKDVALDQLDRSCAPVPFSCNDFAINPAYIPLRGDPRFAALMKKYDTTSQPPASAASARSP